MSDGVSAQSSERDHGGDEERSGGSSRNEPSHGGGQAETTVDPAMKDQPAEGGREEVEEELGER
jgi:hypothetical protein